MPFRHRLRVRYGECDPQGIVFNANYLAYFDVGITELWRATVGPWQVMVDRGVDMVVAEAGTRFVQGSLRHVCVDAATWRKTDIPGWLREALGPYVAG